MNVEEITIDGLFDTGADKTRRRPQESTSIGAPIYNQRGTGPSFQIMVANGDLETPKSNVELKFEIELHEIFIVMEKLTSPILGLMFLQRNHTVLEMRQGILNFPFFSMQLKTADHKYSNVMEPILNPEDVTIPPYDHAVVTIQSRIYAVTQHNVENTVTCIGQPSDRLHEDGNLTFCAAIITLKKGLQG